MSELARIAHAGFYDSFGSGYSGFDEIGESLQRAWDAAAVAVAAHVTTPTAEDFDRAAEELAKPAERYALVEQMGFRRTYATVRETEFCGRPMLEVTSLETGAVCLAAPESLYQVTWLTRTQAEAATRTGSHSPRALSAAIADDLASWGADDEYGDEGKDDGMSQAERDEHADLHGFALDAADEARDLEREAEADA